jgi:hypothetical protein
MNEATASALIRLADNEAKAAAGTLSESDVRGMVNLELPVKERAEYSFILRTKPTHWQAVISETDSLEASFIGVKDLNITSMGSIPLVVISSSATMELAATPELSVKANAVMRQLQQKISEQSTDGSRFVEPDTTHYIQLIKPQAVIDAINRVLGKT